MCEDAHLLWKEGPVTYFYESPSSLGGYFDFILGIQLNVTIKNISHNNLNNSESMLWRWSVRRLQRAKTYYSKSHFPDFLNINEYLISKCAGSIVGVSKLTLICLKSGGIRFQSTYHDRMRFNLFPHSSWFE